MLRDGHITACDHHGITIQLTSGRLRKVERDLVGYDTISYITKFRFDIAFMGVGGIDLEHGIMNIAEEEAHTRHALFMHSRRKIFLVDSRKFADWLDSAGVEVIHG